MALQSFARGNGAVLIHRITLDITQDRRAAGMSLLFALTSGAFLANAISFYSMQAHLTANLLFVWLLLNSDRERALAAGFVGSIALVLHNPVPHALFAAPWFLALAADAQRRRLLLPLIAGYLPVSLGVGLGWFLLRRDIGADAHQAVAISSAALGVFRWPDLAMVNMRIAALVKLWIWSAPGLLVWAVLGRARAAHPPQVRLLTISAVVTFLGFMFVNLDQGHGWGYRYFHPAWGVIPILAGCAMSGRGESQQPLINVAAAGCVLSLLLLIPYQLFQIENRVSAQIARIGTAKRPGNNIYFVRLDNASYSGDLVQIDPWLRDPDLLLASRGAVRDADLMHREWPRAVNLGGQWMQQWYLGPFDQRRSVPGEQNSKHFVFAPAASTRSR